MGRGHFHPRGEYEGAYYLDSDFIRDDDTSLNDMCARFAKAFCKRFNSFINFAGDEYWKDDSVILCRNKLFFIYASPT